MKQALLCAIRRYRRSRKIRKRILYQIMFKTRKVKFREEFNIEECDNNSFIHYFRFSKDQFAQLLQNFDFPHHVTLKNRAVVKDKELLLILLKRFAYPCRLLDLSIFFKLNISTISYSIDYSTKFLYSKYSNILYFDSERIFQNLERYAERINNKGGSLLNCVGFIDGTVRPICRPTNNQRDYYNGHKRVHSLKYQAIMFPDGIIGHISGPFDGRRHDASIYALSGIDAEIRPFLHKNGIMYHIYGDPAYPLSSFIISPFGGSRTTLEQEEFNKSMSSVRETVEWGFSRVVANFAFLDFKKNLKLEIQDIGHYYPIGVLLTNCYSCLNDNQISIFFNLPSPSLSVYLKTTNTASIFYFVLNYLVG